MSPFKANYRYKPRTSLTPRQAKKTSTEAKERIKEIIELHKNLRNTVKMVQECIKRYYNKKRSEGPALKEGDKVWLLYKNFKSRRLSKKLDHVKLGLFKIVEKISEVIYQLDLLVKIKIYPVQYIIMLEPVQGNIKPLIYKINIYKGQEEDKWDI